MSKLLCRMFYRFRWFHWIANQIDPEALQRRVDALNERYARIPENIVYPGEFARCHLFMILDIMQANGLEVMEHVFPAEGPTFFYTRSVAAARNRYRVNSATVEIPWRAAEEYIAGRRG